MANKDLVVKLTINSQDFDNGLRNAKSSMNKFQKDTLSVSSVFKSAIGGMTKAFGALGIAVGGAQLFKSFINSTQTMGDAWNNTMVAAKTSFQVFETAVASGTSGILSNFKESIAAAREFAQAMDAFGSAQISNQYARMEYVTPFNEAMTKYRSAKSSGDTTQMAFAASDMRRMIQAYSDNASTLMSKAMEAVTAKLSAYTGGFVNSGNVGRYLDQLYLEIINGVFPPILQDFNNLKNEQRKGDYFANQAIKEMESKYGPDWKREAEAMKALSEINDDTLKEMLGVLKTYDQVRNEINSMRRQMNRVVNGEGGGGGTVTMPTTTPTRARAELIPELSPISAVSPDNTTDMIAALGDKLARMYEESEENMLISDMMNKMWQKNIDTLGTYASTIGSVSDAFNALGSAMGDTPFGGFLSTLGAVAQGITSLISTYASLISVQAVQESLKAGFGIPFPFNIAMIATAVSAIGGVIASAKSTFAGSFASGGIVGGNSYSGDNLWARVNSGEMIVPYNDWHNGGQSNVHFIIEGSQLKGVLDNYNKTANL